MATEYLYATAGYSSNWETRLKDASGWVDVEGTPVTLAYTADGHTGEISQAMDVDATARGKLSCVHACPSDALPGEYEAKIIAGVYIWPQGPPTNRLIVIVEAA